jgi:hypothetical protein
MDTFVVRVYRSGQDLSPDEDRLRGVVDEISTGLRTTFHDTQELLAILRRPQALPTRGGANEPGQHQAR